MSDFRACLIGASGAFGVYTASTLAAFDDCEAVVAVGRSTEKLNETQAIVGDKFVSVPADIRDATVIDRSVVGCDVILNASGPSSELAKYGVDLALRTGLPYADLCDDSSGYEQLMGRHDEAVAAGIPIIAGCGCSAGITNIAATEVAEAMDTVDGIDIFHGAPPGESLGGMANLRHLLDLIDSTSPALVDGELIEEETFSVRQPHDFGPAVGVIDCTTISHPEPLMFRREIPNLQTSRVWLGLLPQEQMEMLSMLAGSGLASDSRVQVDGHEVSVRDVVAAHLFARSGTEQDLSSDGPLFAVQVVARGKHDGVPTQVTMSTLQGAGRMTGVPLAVGGRWLSSGRIDTPGVHTAGAVVLDRSAFREELQQHGADLLSESRREPLGA